MQGTFRRQINEPRGFIIRQGEGYLQAGWSWLSGWRCLLARTVLEKTSSFSYREVRPEKTHQRHLY
jgi:hypothetical protein